MPHTGIHCASYRRSISSFFAGSPSHLHPAGGQWVCVRVCVTGCLYPQDFTSKTGGFGVKVSETLRPLWDELIVKTARVCVCVCVCVFVHVCVSRSSTTLEDQEVQRWLCVFFGQMSISHQLHLRLLFHKGHWSAVCHVLLILAGIRFFLSFGFPSRSNSINILA